MKTRIARIETCSKCGNMDRVIYYPTLVQQREMREKGQTQESWKCTKCGSEHETKIIGVKKHKRVSKKFQWEDGDVQIHGTGTQGAGSEPDNTPAQDYRGIAETRRVWHGTRELNPARSQRIVNHSPDGFNWGYGGSGPAQLALAILLEYLPENQADRHHQNFKWAVISRLPQTDFTLEEKTVLDWIIENVKDRE